MTHHAPFRDDTVPIRVTFTRDRSTNFAENEWDFERSPSPPASDAECEAISEWVNELGNGE